MGSLENPKTWVPYMINTKDCSQGFCSLYCPQWCNIIFPPPPPFEFLNEHKDSKFSPLLVALIGILACAFLLVSYYIIMSKYCKNRDSSNGREDQDPNLTDESLGNQDSPSHDQMSQQQAPNSGLDEALIKSITMFKYKKEVGFIEATDCSVCLSEFQENESLRLLPKCSHAFHKTCIDTWLKSHSNCPLCRANIVFVNSLTPQLSPVLEPPTHERSLSQTSQEEDIEMGIQEMDLYPNNPGESPSSMEDSDFVTSIGVMKNKEGERIRRSVSMNDCCMSHGHGQLSIADVLHIDQGKDEEDECPHLDGGETSKRPGPVVAKSRRFCGNCVVHCAAAGCGGVRMSISSERFLLSNGGKGRDMSSIPL